MSIEAEYVEAEYVKVISIEIAPKNKERFERLVRAQWREPSIYSEYKEAGTLTRLILMRSSAEEDAVGNGNLLYFVVVAFSNAESEGAFIADPVFRRDLDMVMALTEAVVGHEGPEISAEDCYCDDNE